ncbi:MAG: hypothetical protein CMM52_09815 [Rhodospirillaceae bacterium]|nr:hypothetical protein [Rhodospirillaceae bacterium]
MTLFFPKSQTVAGVSIPGRRYTAWAALYFVLFFCIPIMVVALALDTLFYFIFQEFFDSCYAVMCLSK